MSTAVRSRGQRPAAKDADGAGASASARAEGPVVYGQHHGGPSAWDERYNMLLLVLLYMIQGIPLGLTTGAL